VITEDIVVGTVEDAEEFPEARKPRMLKLWIDTGSDTVQSAAQLGYHHTPEELKECQVLCVEGLGEMRIAGFKSEVLTLGVPGTDGNPVLVTPEEQVPEVGELH